MVQSPSNRVGIATPTPVMKTNYDSYYHQQQIKKA